MIACLGEALVDLICERRVSSFADADSFTPHFGGALANVAVAAKRAGADAGLAGGAGDDDWGRWLEARLVREGVDLSFFGLAPGVTTPVAFAITDEAGEPTFTLYGDAITEALEGVEPRLGELADAAEALVFSSNTLVADGERRITLAARTAALERDVPVCFDPNMRPNRWGGETDRAVEVCRELLPGSFLVRCNRDEAEAITGTANPRRAAEELVGRGAELAVVTAGAEGAVMRGACDAELPAPRVDVVSTLGAGDAFMGTLVAGIAATGWSAADAGQALEPALAAAAEACARWPALA